MLLGTVGAICFALSGLPQAIKSWRDGHSDGVAHGTVWLWLIGEGLMLAYALYFYTQDWILTTNYTANFLLVSIIFKFKYWRRKVLKTRKEKREVVETVVEDIICNGCGNSLKDSCDMNFEGLCEAKITGGYASKIGDMTQVSFSLCEDCLLTMFDKFTHPPHYGDAGAFAGDDFEQNDEDEDESSDNET